MELSKIILKAEILKFEASRDAILQSDNINFDMAIKLDKAINNLKDVEFCIKKLEGRYNETTRLSNRISQ